MMIRIAQDGDLPRIVEIYNQAVESRGSTADILPQSVDSRRDWFTGHAPDRHPIWVAERDDCVVAWCSLSPHRPGRLALRFVAEISYYVHDGHRREGIASALVRHAIDRCPKLEIKHLYAMLLDVNAPSIALLTKFGFEKWGLMPGVAEVDGKCWGHVTYGRRV